MTNKCTYPNCPSTPHLTEQGHLFCDVHEALITARVAFDELNLLSEALNGVAQRNKVLLNAQPTTEPEGK